MSDRIEVGTRLRFTVRPEHYLSVAFVVGQIYEVAAISLHYDNRVPEFKLKGKEDIGWMTERFFTKVIE